MPYTQAEEKSIKKIQEQLIMPQLYEYSLPTPHAAEVSWLQMKSSSILPALAIQKVTGQKLQVVSHSKQQYNLRIVSSEIDHSTHKVATASC